MTDDQTLKLSPIFNRCLIDLECIGNFDFLSKDRDQAMQILMDAVDAAVTVVNNSTMDSIDDEIGRLEDEIVESAVAHYKALEQDSLIQINHHANRYRKAVDALITAREKAEHRLTPSS